MTTQIEKAKKASSNIAELATNVFNGIYSLDNALGLVHKYSIGHNHKGEEDKTIPWQVKASMASKYADFGMKTLELVQNQELASDANNLTTKELEDKIKALEAKQELGKTALEVNPEIIDDN